MINEIVRARKVLNVYLKKNTSDYDFSNFISNLDGKEITSMKAIANIN